MQILREKTSWSSVEHNVTNMDYLINDQQKMVAIRKFGDNQPWQKFSKPMSFSKRYRSFQKLKEPVPTEFVKPFSPDPWDNTSYNSLETFM